MNRWIVFVTACGLVMAVGCQPTEISEHASSDSSSCGYFEGEVVASWDSDGRRMMLREDFSYVDTNNRRWLAPVGSVVDGASIPAAFWTFVGGPFEGQYREASVVHDVACNEMSASWEDVHRMFYDACVCGGVDQQTAKVLYYAVYHFGPRWEPVVESVVETHENAQGQIVQERVQRRRMKRASPTPPTVDEIQQVVAMVEDDNPAPVELEQTTREVLHRRPRRGRNSKGYGRQSPGNFVGNPTQNTYSDQTPTRSENSLPPDQQGRGQFGSVQQPGFTQGLNQQIKQPSLDAQQQTRRSSRNRNQVSNNIPNDIPETEKQWVAQKVQSHVVSRLSQPDPDDYDVSRTQEGYRVIARYYERDQQGQPIAYSNFNLTARVSSAGEVLEVLR